MRGIFCSAVAVHLHLCNQPLLAQCIHYLEIGTVMLQDVKAASEVKKGVCRAAWPVFALLVCG